MAIPTPASNPCSLVHRLPRGLSENLSPTQTYRLAHSVECRLMLNAERTDRNLRFILGHAFTLDKIKLRIVAIEEEEQKAQAARAARAAAKPNSSGRVSFRDSGSSKLRNEIRSSSPAGSPSRRRASPPPPTKAAYNSDSDTSSDDEEDESLVLTLTSSNRSNAGTKIPDLALSSDDEDSSSEDEEEEELIRSRLSDSVLETIIEEPGDETLAELYETVAGCPCHGKESPVIEQIWEIPPAILEEEQKKHEEREGLNKSSNDKKRLDRPLGARRRIGVVRVAA